jgi:hypothetical protein
MDGVVLLRIEGLVMAVGEGVVRMSSLLVVTLASFYTSW